MCFDVEREGPGYRIVFARQDEFGLWFQSLFVGITAWAVAICIFIVIYGRMLEVYLTASIAPIPMATMMGREWGGMGQNYLNSLFALAFQAF